MFGTFDLVHMTCMCWALTVQGYKSALQNPRDPLRPGRHLILRDGDPLVFTHDNPPPLEGHEHDIAACTQGRTTLATINRIYSGWALRHGLVLVSRIIYGRRSKMRLYRSSSTRVLAPHGEYCASHKGVNGTPLSEFTEFSLQSFTQVTNVLTPAMMEAGCLELSDGTRIADEVGRQALMKELRDFAEGGILLLMSEWVALRPLGS
ncbi:hypothetical protein EDB87DRAFT_1631458 [Lactarius vividus]|nr:hypothetical protein EDB87DRAFT_1631458 [Lactarius vividus]